MSAPAPVDRFQRPLRNLRISVTDRCNLRCQYCMPEAEYNWLPRHDILTFEEVHRLLVAMVPLGVDRVRLTGGEPLLRRDLTELVERIAGVAGVRDLAMTSNAVLFAEQGPGLRAAGLQRVTFSLDSLRRDRYRSLCGRDQLLAARRGIDVAAGLGFASVKINTVVMRGANDDELLDLLEFGAEVGAEVRFIEYMDVGGATRWQRDVVVDRDEILTRIGAVRGPVEAVAVDPAAPARRYRCADGTEFGVIASTTAPFCGTCDRGRLTADGVFYTCLYGKTGVDLRKVLRGGADADELRQVLAATWAGRADRGAEQRLRLAERGALAGKPELDADPHLEMHTRGG